MAAARRCAAGAFDDRAETHKRMTAAIDSVIERPLSAALLCWPVRDTWRAELNDRNRGEADGQPCRPYDRERRQRASAAVGHEDSFAALLLILVGAARAWEAIP